jgi:hypothetical protein
LAVDDLRGVAVTDGKICAFGYYGLSISTDNGVTWTQPSNDIRYIYDVALSGSVVCVATEFGLYISVDDGETWSLYDRTNGLGSTIVKAVKVSGTKILPQQRTDWLCQRIMAQRGLVILHLPVWLQTI